MQRIDAVIVAALVLAAAGSALGVLTYRDDRLATFEIAWTTRTHEAESDEVTHAGAGEVETTIEVDQPNATRITFDVGIGAGAARPAATAVRIDVVSPTNDTTSVETELPAGATGTINVPVEVELASVPTATSMTGPSLAAARNALNATFSSTLGMGTWTIRASFAPTLPGPLGDEDHRLAAIATIESYEAELSLVTPEVPR